MNPPTHAMPAARGGTPDAGTIPWPLWAGVALMLLALGAVAAFRFMTTPADGLHASASAPGQTWLPSEVTWQRALHFEDSPDGQVLVRDAASGREIARYAGEQGFVRGALRVLTRERARRGIGAQPPFLLVGHGPSRLMLADPATGERIHLESFGPANVAVFAQLREAGR